MKLVSADREQPRRNRIPPGHRSGRILGFVFLLGRLLAGAGAAEPGLSAPGAPEEEAYRQTIATRAERILRPLQLQDLDTSNRVHALLMRHYRNLRDLHDQRDVALRSLKDASPGAPDRAAEESRIRHATRHQLDALHTNFVQALARELTPAQVDQVKDGMTYNLVEVTYRAYLRLLPELSESQKQQIRSWLLEARELAMDEGTAREKHAVFNRYKGRINNYLSAAGYDLKAAERRLREASKAPASAPAPAE